MSGIFQSPSDGYEDVPLEKDEHVLRRQAASYVKGGLPVVGGQLVVTNRRVPFRPLDTTGVNRLLQEGFYFLPEGLAQFGKVATKLANAANEYIEGKAGAWNTGTSSTSSLGEMRAGYRQQSHRHCC